MNPRLDQRRTFQTVSGRVFLRSSDTRSCIAPVLWGQKRPIAPPQPSSSALPLRRPYVGVRRVPRSTLASFPPSPCPCPLLCSQHPATDATGERIVPRPARVAV